MSEISDYQPFSPELGIAGSSYRLQMGRVNEFWAIRLVKGKDVLASKVWKEYDEMPNGNKLTGWALSVLTLPNLNTYQIQKTVGFIRQKALRNYEDYLLAKKTAGKSESTTLKLESVPENTQLKRPKSQGWVKEDTKSESATGSSSASPDASLSPALAASNAVATGKPVKTTGGRKLEAIPRGAEFVPAKHPEVIEEESKVDTPTSQSQASSPKSLDVTSVSSKTNSPDLLSRIEKLESLVSELQKENQSIREELAQMKK